MAKSHLEEFFVRFKDDDCLESLWSENRGEASEWVRVEVTDHRVALEAGPRGFEVKVGAGQVSAEIDATLAWLLRRNGIGRSVEIVSRATEETLWTVRLLERRDRETRKEMQRWETLKQEGNEKVREAAFDEAEKKYRMAIEIVKTLMVEDGPARRDDLATLHLNLALALLKQGEDARCVVHCDEAERLGLSTAKCFYRRALALEALGQLDAARQDLIRAQHANEGDPLIRRHLMEVDKKSVERNRVCIREFTRTYGLELKEDLSTRVSRLE